MSLTTAKGKAASKRFPMVRLEVAWYPTGWALYSSSPYIYSVSVPASFGAVHRVAVDGTEYTAAASLGAIGASQFYFDSPTSTLYLYLGTAGAPNTSDTTGRGSTIAYYYIYFTTGETRYKPSTPTSGGSDVEWSPRITDYSPATSGFRNLLSGVITTSDMNISLANPDGALDAHLTSNHSFRGGKVDIWLFIDSDGGLVYQGGCVEYEKSSDTLSLSCADLFDKLAAPASMDDYSSVIYLTNDGSAVNTNVTKIQPGFEKRPVPYIAGKRSFVDYDQFKPSTNTPDSYRMRDANRAACITYNANKTASNNRIWRLCRTGGTSAYRAQSMVTIQASAVVDTAYVAIRFASHNLLCGEYVNYNTTRWGVVLLNQSFTVSGTPYNCLLADSVGAGAIATSTSAHSKPAVFIRNTSLSNYPVAVNPDNINLLGTDSERGSTIRDIELTGTLSNVIETVGDYIDPDNDYIYYLVQPDQSTPGTTHAKVVKRLVEKAGLTANSASFTTADSAVSAHAVMDIPSQDESDFGTYRDYLEGICTSVGAILRFNTGQEVEYIALAASAGGDSIGSGDVMRDSLSAKVSTQDIETDLQPFNPHTPERRAIDGVTEAAATSRKAYRLHGRSVAARFRHLLDDISGRLAFILTLRKSPQRRYTFTTDTATIDKLPGDDLTLDFGAISGGSVDVKIVEISKHSDETTVTAIEI